MNVIIIHGAYGHPDENWIPWLKEELERLNCKVFIPKFPTPENQNLESWLNVFKSYEKHLNKDSIIIGHSLGVAFILNVLSKSNKRVNAVFFIAGFLGKINNKEFDEINKSFFENELDWSKIRNNCKNFFVYHSDNDPYVPVEKGKELAGKLSVKVKLIKNACHFNTAAGYDKFPLLLEDIKKISSSYFSKEKGESKRNC